MGNSVIHKFIPSLWITLYARCGHPAAGHRNIAGEHLAEPVEKSCNPHSARPGHPTTNAAPVPSEFLGAGAAFVLSECPCPRIQRGSVEIGQRLLEMAPGRIVDGGAAFDVTQRGAFACRVHISSWRAVSSSSTMLGCHDVMIFSFSSRPRVSPARIRAPPSRYPTMSMR